MTLPTQKKPVSSRTKAPLCAAETDRRVGSTDSGVDQQVLDDRAPAKSSRAWQLTTETFQAILQRPPLANLLRHIHVMLVFFWRLSVLSSNTALYLTDKVPWDMLVTYLNRLLPDRSSQKTIMYFAETNVTDIEDPAFPTPDRGDRRQLPEDFLIRGQKWAKGYFPEDWFAGASGDEDERMMELPSTWQLRVDRVLWLSVRLAEVHDRASGGAPEETTAASSEGGRKTGASDEERKKSRPSGELAEPRTADQTPSEGNADDERGRWLHWNPSLKQFSVSSKFADTRQAQVSPSSWNPAQSAEADRGGAGEVDLER